MSAILPLINASFSRLLKPALHTDLSTYLYNNMPRQSINNNRLLPQRQRRHQLFSKLLNVPFNLPYSRLVQIPAAFGEVVYWQLLRRGAVDVVGKGREGGGIDLR